MDQCEECGTRPANIHLTQIVENESQSFHLCEECAKKRGINISIDGEQVLAVPDSPAPQEPDTECAACHMKLSEFRSKGWLGCPACYTAFETEIEGLLRESHGSTEHKGKAYRRNVAVGKAKTDVSRLRSELDSAIKNEEFERAAKLRDAIHSLTGMESR
jgi:protein arginine kinase activator